MSVSFETRYPPPDYEAAGGPQESKNSCTKESMLLIVLKPLPEFWEIQGKYQQYIIVFVLFCQESKFLFNKVSASNDMFKRESLHS